RSYDRNRPLRVDAAGEDRHRRGGAPVQGRQPTGVRLRGISRWMAPRFLTVRATGARQVEAIGAWANVRPGTDGGQGLTAVRNRISVNGSGLRRNRSSRGFDAGRRRTVL